MRVVGVGRAREINLNLFPTDKVGQIAVGYCRVVNGGMLAPSGVHQSARTLAHELLFLEGKTRGVKLDVTATIDVDLVAICMIDTISTRELVVSQVNSWKRARGGVGKMRSFADDAPGEAAPWSMFERGVCEGWWVRGESCPDVHWGERRRGGRGNGNDRCRSGSLT